MNNIEDKELQELFDAKRTVEANRRRQEELRRLIEAQAAPKSRRLWPVWTGAAAAAIALLLLMLPALFGNQETPSTLIAEAEVPEVRVVEDTGFSSQASPTSPARKTRKTRKPSEAAPAARPVAAEPSPLPEPAVEVHIEEPDEKPVVVEVPVETIVPAPRVIRRQSTLIACTEGCKAPEGTSEASSRNVQINFFNNDNYADATIYSIPIKK